MADSCRIRRQFRVASVPVARQPPSHPACAGRIPRRLRHASWLGADRVDSAGPARCSHRTCLARIPVGWRVSSRTGSRRAGARSTRAQDIRHQIGETRGPGSQGVSDRGGGIEAPGRGWLAEGRVPVACSCFRFPPSCANGSRDPRCLPSACSHRPRRNAAANRLYDRVVDVMQIHWIQRFAAKTNWPARPRYIDSRMEDGAVGCPGGFNTVSACEGVL